MYACARSQSSDRKTENRSSRRPWVQRAGRGCNFLNFLSAVKLLEIHPAGTAHDLLLSL